MSKKYIYNVDEILDKMPLDIVREIIPYTYQIQNNTLLEDIKHFVNSKKYILKMYNETLIFNYPKPLEWLEHDLFVHLNNDLIGGDEYIIGINEILKRNYRLKDKSRHEVNEIISKMNSKIVNVSVNGLTDEYDYVLNKSINMMWSHLNVEERQGFIRLCNQKALLYSSHMIN